MPDRITIQSHANAPVHEAWDAYTNPERIRLWNFASSDWHCPAATVDLRNGGAFSFRMEAKDGSMGFDFEGTYTLVIPDERIEYEFGNRRASVEFISQGDGTLVRVTFDPEDEFPIEQQRDGWQSILDNYGRHLSGPAQA